MGIFAKSINFRKADDEKRQVFGIVYEPDVVDLQGEFTDANEIEKAAHMFLENYRVLGDMHMDKVAPEDAAVIESYVAPCEFIMGGQRVTKGSWVIGVQVHADALWKRIKDGEITGFSMGGFATVEE